VVFPESINTEFTKILGVLVRLRHPLSQVAFSAEPISEKRVQGRNFEGV